MQTSPDGSTRRAPGSALSIAERLRSASERPAPAETVGALIVIAVELDACDSVGVVGAVGAPSGRAVAPALATDDLAADADRAQCERADGPSLAAMRSGRPVIAVDLDADPAWADACAPAPVGALLAVPLDPGNPLGALTLYSRAPRDFSDEDRALAETLAAHVCVALRHGDAIDTLRRAVDSRTVIGQAQGILMERHRITAADAFAALVRCSQNRNVKLAVLAQELTATGTVDGLATALGRLSPGATPGA
ncbi:ANTAR domain-containing protein [Nakamurella deserti]|uniref:ANTAR domain-containing protein n=1 Tax=Nakamurella deserti TaxID=2164074 RepID=UPI000DBE2025|nr:GAF and ANTAR domain-containing protein [Nakamurella deserti]